MREPIIGFSSGGLYKYLPRSAELTAEYLHDLGANAIEFHNLDLLLDSIDLIKFDQFEFISIHAPIMSGNEEKIIDQLRFFSEKVKLDNITVHPNEVLDFKKLAESGLPFSIENMDKNKETGKTVESLRPIFEKYNFGFVLDVNHCYTNNPTGELLQEMIDTFGDKIRMLHLSGYKKLHEPIVFTKQDFLIEAIKDLNKPVIIESVFDLDEKLDLKMAKEEIKLIKKVLKSKELIKK